MRVMSPHDHGGIKTSVTSMKYSGMPFSSIKLKKMLGMSDEQGTNWIWDRNQLIPGVDIPKPVPLFKKLDIDSED